MEQTPPEKRIGKLFFTVTGYYHNGTMLRFEVLSRFNYIKAHLIQFVKQIVGKFQICFVDFVYEKYYLLFGPQGLSELAQLDVLLDIGYVLIVKTRIIQPLYRIVNIKAFAGLGCGLDIPRDQAETQVFGDYLCQFCFSGPGLSLQ
jgi:hypothetical protein